MGRLNDDPHLWSNVRGAREYAGKEYFVLVEEAEMDDIPAVIFATSGDIFEVYDRNEYQAGEFLKLKSEQDPESEIGEGEFSWYWEVTKVTDLT